MNYDFETIRAKLTGAHVSDNARRNRLYPTDVQILSVLELHQERGPIHSLYSEAQMDIWSAGLLEYAPLTVRQEKLQKAGKAWSLRRKLQITTEGRAYLWRLELIMRRAKLKADRNALRRYERHGARRRGGMVRWVAALHPPLDANAALDVLYAEYNAAKMDNRALMAGAL